MSRAARRPGRHLVVEADGGSRGNPGVAGYGALVRDSETGQVLIELAEPLGTASNNVAEYSGLIAGLRSAIEIDPAASVRVRMDSKLVVEQMSGRWKIKHEDMRRLALEARELCSTLIAGGGSVDFEWIPRESNKAADALSNEAMDGHTVRRVITAPATGEPADTAATPLPGRGPAGPGGPERTGLRLLLVQAPDDPGVVPRIASAVARLVGSSARVLGTPDPTAAAVLETLGETLDTTPVADSAWAGHGATGGHDTRVSAAYDSLLEAGGTVVAVTSRRGVLTVLSDVLGLPDERFWSIATAPGSLTGIEVWPDGSASVAFTNRTDHLA